MSDQIRKEVRREVRRIRLGTDRPVACAVCGETNPALLRRASAALIAYHHLAAWVNDPDLGVFLCLTHHAWCTERMRDQGIPLCRAQRPVLLELLEAVLRGLAIFFELAARLLQAWADDLASLIAALDRFRPDWRQLPEAS